MNKKKKTSRLKHRKNQERMKNIIRASRLKAKPKKVEAPKEVESVVQVTEEVKKPTEVKKAPAKKPATKKPLVKKPHQMSYAELKRKCAKYQSRLLESVQKIFEADGLNYRNGELTSYVVYLFLYDCLYNQTTNPFFHKLYEHLEHNPDDREKLKIQIHLLR